MQNFKTTKHGGGGFRGIGFGLQKMPDEIQDQRAIIDSSKQILRGFRGLLPNRHCFFDFVFQSVSSFLCSTEIRQSSRRS
jgi:hypothetical protein